VQDELAVSDIAEADLLLTLQPSWLVAWISCFLIENLLRDPGHLQRPTGPPPQVYRGRLHSFSSNDVPLRILGQISCSRSCPGAQRRSAEPSKSESLTEVSVKEAYDVFSEVTSLQYEPLMCLRPLQNSIRIRSIMLSFPRILVGEKLPSAMKHDFIDDYGLDNVTGYVSFWKDQCSMLRLWHK
jgi:hypothetical protein